VELRKDYADSKIASDELSAQSSNTCEMLREAIRNLEATQRTLVDEKKTLLERNGVIDKQSTVLSEQNTKLKEEIARLANEKTKLIEENSELAMNAELQANRTSDGDSRAGFGHLVDFSLQLSGSSDAIQSPLAMHLTGGRSSMFGMFVSLKDSLSTLQFCPSSKKIERLA
jgi:hypothetical protein